MGKLSDTDKHNPIVQTDQPSPEAPKPTLNSPGHHSPQPVKKEVQSDKEEHKKTGTQSSKQVTVPLLRGGEGVHHADRRPWPAWATHPSPCAVFQTEWLDWN
jgi:hypothetical protein